MIFISKYIVPKGFTAITLYPFIFCKNEWIKKDAVSLNHERIHLKQQMELAIIFFYLFYCMEWFIKLLKYRNKNIAYQNISFEKEAYLYESDFQYLKKRKAWSFLKYL